MGIVFRQSVKTGIVVLSGALLGAFTIWLSAKYLTKQELGFTRNLASQAVTLSQLLMLGLNSTLFVYTHRFINDKAKKQLLISLCLIVPLIGTLLFTIVYFSFKDRILAHFQPGDIPLMRQYFAWLPFYTIVMLYMAILEQYLSSQMKVAVSAFMREVLLRVLNIALIILFAYGSISFHTLAIGSILIYLVPVLVFFFLASRSNEFALSFNMRVFNKGEYKELIHFTWYHLLLNLSVILMSYLDVLSLSFYDHNGFSSVAVYAVAVYLISFLQMPAKAFLPASFSTLTSAITQQDMKKARDIFSRSSLNLLIPTIGIAILLSCNLHNAVTVIGTGRNYSGITPVFLILMCGQLINLSTGMNDQVLSITNYYKFNFYASISISALLYILIRILVPRYGIYGAACSSAITLMIFNVLKYIVVWKRSQMQPFSKGTVLVVLAGVPALAAGYFFPHFFNEARHIYVNAFADTAIRSVIIMIVYVSMLLWLKPSADLQEYIQQIKKNKRLF